jgi:heme-degrading monooxygenase HmoA
MNRSYVPVLLGLLLSACAASPPPASQTSPMAATTEKVTPTAATTNATAAPAAGVVIIHELGDYKTWRAVFDEHAASRKSHKITQSHVNQSADNPNLVAVYLAADSASAIQEFASDPELKTVMTKGGVKGAPTVIPLTPTEDHTIKTRALAGAIIQFKVANYETWKSAFDGNAADRAKAGIVGHAVNRVSPDPNTVVVYLQSESLDALRAFTASPELRATQQRAGVQGPPQITFWQGNVWGQ